MKPTSIGLLLCILLRFASVANAQDAMLHSPVGYTERVVEEGPEPELLFRRTLDWVESNFTYTPKTIIRNDAAKGDIRVAGTTKVKTASPSGQLQEHAVLFEFSFHALPTGYEYSVGYLRVVPDTKKPETTIPFEDFVTQLSMERNNARTHNDRRVTAQATSMASEVAMAYRSYMNSRPAAGAIE